MLEKRVKSGLAVTPRHLKLCDDKPAAGRRRLPQRLRGAGHRVLLLPSDLPGALRDGRKEPGAHGAVRDAEPRAGHGTVQAVGGGGHHDAHPGADGAGARQRGAAPSRRTAPGRSSAVGRAPTFLQSARRERDGLTADDSARFFADDDAEGRRSHVKEG